MALGKVKESIKMRHANICIYFVVQINIGSVAEREK